MGDRVQAFLHVFSGTKVQLLKLLIMGTKLGRKTWQRHLAGKGLYVSEGKYKYMYCTDDSASRTVIVIYCTNIAARSMTNI